LVVTLGEDQVKHVVEKLEGLRLELLKLRSMLVSEENSTPEELEEIRNAKDEIRRGEFVSLKTLLEESGE
jgi:wyosine [tRNA(Phe)-imidazoG37] synthetase (radical SAM superfamily)